MHAVSSISLYIILYYCLFVIHINFFFFFKANCQKACKKCDDARPCPRCIKYGIADTCVNSVRKERKKGIKRGPYKRRQKTGGKYLSFGERERERQ